MIHSAVNKLLQVIHTFSNSFLYFLVFICRKEQTLLLFTPPPSDVTIGKNTVKDSGFCIFKRIVDKTIVLADAFALVSHQRCSPLPHCIITKPSGQ